jgi:hypothetical protein
MDKHEYGRVGARGAENVELLDRAWAIRDALRLTKAPARFLAVAGAPRLELAARAAHRSLVVGGVEFDLVIIQEDEGTLGMRRRANAAVRRGLSDRGRYHRRAGGCARRCADDAAPRHVATA